MNRMTRLTTALLVLTTLLTACEASEGKQCTLIGCANGLGVAFQTASWPAGTWKVIAQTPSGERSCTVTLPLPSNGQAQCNGQMQLGTSGSALSPDQQSLTGVHLPDTPTALTLQVLRDDKLVAQNTFAPKYTTSQPNGPDCEPVCTQANEVLSW